jgi:predicted RNA-binding Zn-ribbon protein involved in translation (DUF1610 family)
MDESKVIILAGLISLIIIIVFLVMAAKINKIANILEFFKDLELKKLENWIIFPCEKCGKEVKVFRTERGVRTCPHCGNVITIPE